MKYQNGKRCQRVGSAGMNMGSTPISYGKRSYQLAKRLINVTGLGIGFLARFLTLTNQPVVANTGYNCLISITG